MTTKIWLIVRADRSVRVIRRWPNLRDDEVAIAINLKFPDGWGKIISTLDVAVPDETPAAEVEP